MVFRAWYFLLWLVGKLVLFWRRQKLTDEDIERCYAVLSRCPFAVIGVGSRRFVTGLLLPRGKHDVEHTAVWIGNGIVVESVMPRVRALSLRRFLKQYDNVTIVAFRSMNWFDSGEYATQAIDRRYDVIFKAGRKTFYCHEFAAECLHAGGIDISPKNDFYVFDDLADVGAVILEIRK